MLTSQEDTKILASKSAGVSGSSAIMKDQYLHLRKEKGKKIR